MKNLAWNSPIPLFRVSPTISPYFCTVWTVNGNILLLLIYFFKYIFQQILYHFSISFKYYFLFHYLFFFFTTIFFNDKCCVHNIFRNTFTKKFMWKIVISFNLNSPLKLFFYLPILTNNNLLLKIYYENIVVAFLN